MEKREIMARVDAKLAEFHLTRDSLTAQELDRLCGEVVAESEGGLVMDGVLSDPKFLRVLDKDAEVLERFLSDTQRSLEEARASGDAARVEELSRDVSSIKKKMSLHKRFKGIE